MTTDQKKKLLWGNKKNTTVEEVLPFFFIFEHIHWEFTISTQLYHQICKISIACEGFEQTMTRFHH